ncbi:hypothetical protein QI30_19450 [Kurthia sp. 3B1D]|uniref:Antitoxin VbhA domain-containing protein n=1 Tax=Candidatus Kurthia intestinigallinarum TaxID=1562256 RepID=A0A433RNS8_9BACL|nr:antitoxin VbhA family protein [Kurthia sp. 3B1D]RUS49612.1 hypothetical protein QI30_19860 [Kurthia sp. 3B1D]RUS49730.1 hypothetical protein QI30_19770 [Kurthia sp. 3B1D]RUS50211.1 hypothetical protein QI30_19450 [Kurthia sp. 3B1D]
MKANSRLERQQQVRFAVGMAALDGGKPTSFTQNLLNQYENGEVSSSQLKQAILQKYAKATN